MNTKREDAKLERAFERPASVHNRQGRTGRRFRLRERTDPLVEGPQPAPTPDSKSLSRMTVQSQTRRAQAQALIDGSP